MGKWCARALAISLLCLGCTGSISLPKPLQSAPTPGPDPMPMPMPEDPGPPAVAAPLPRLTSAQYNNTLADLFAPIAVAPQQLPGEVVIESFDNNTTVQTPSAALITAYQQSAQSVAEAVMTAPSAVLGCTPANRAAEDACATQFIATFLPKAFRRPVDTDERDAYGGFYTQLRSDGTTDFPTAMTLVIEAVLQSPDFLYRVELGAPITGQPDRVQLTPYEIANRLSYLVWNTMPDDALLAAAASGDLNTAEGLATQAQRLLADPRAQGAVGRFHRQWLKLDKLQGQTKDPVLFPNFDASTVTHLQQSAQLYVDHQFFSGGTLASLLTDDHAYVDDTLADIYGVSSPGPSLQLVQVDGTQRSGILTHPALLAAFAHPSSDSPVLRGVFVLDNVMCSGLPPPPAGVNTSLPAQSDGGVMTTRQEFATQHEQGGCASCHHTIDGIGFGFESYDAIGKWRTQDQGLQVDSTGWFTAKYDDQLSGDFDGAVQLGQKLAKSPTVQRCFAQNWLRYALGVGHTGVDKQMLAPIVTAANAQNDSLEAFVIAVIQSDAFNTRVVEAP
ncbi:MAG: DUF1592 domain-containing protein [Myxococcaceae bacterium]